MLRTDRLFALLRRPAMRRLAWTLFLAIHLPIFTRAVGALLSEFRFDTLVPTAALSLTILFFLLKIADVAWLRFPKRGRTVLVFVLVVAFLHRDAVFGRATAAEFLECAPAVVLMVELTRGVWLLRRKLVQSLGTLMRPAGRQPLRAPNLDRFGPVVVGFSHFSITISPARGPPDDQLV